MDGFAKLQRFFFEVESVPGLRHPGRSEERRAYKGSHRKHYTTFVSKSVNSVTVSVTNLPKKPEHRRRCVLPTDRKSCAMLHGALSMRHEYRLTALETGAKTSYANTRHSEKNPVGGLSRAHGWSRDLDSSQAVAREGLG